MRTGSDCSHSLTGGLRKRKSCFPTEGVQRMSSVLVRFVAVQYFAMYAIYRSVAKT